MVNALDSGASGPGSSPDGGHCVVFLGKTLYSHGASLYPGGPLGSYADLPCFESLNLCNLGPLMFLKPEHGTHFGQSLPVCVIRGSTPLPPRCRHTLAGNFKAKGQYLFIARPYWDRHSQEVSLKLSSNIYKNNICDLGLLHLRFQQITKT